MPFATSPMMERAASRALASETCNSQAGCGASAHANCIARGRFCPACSAAHPKAALLVIENENVAFAYGHFKASMRLSVSFIADPERTQRGYGL